MEFLARTGTYILVFSKNPWRSTFTLYKYSKWSLEIANFYRKFEATFDPYQERLDVSWSLGRQKPFVTV